MSDNLDQQVIGPVVKLAARVAELLDGARTDVQTDYGLFHVGKVELGYSHGGDYAVVGYLTPDEGDGSTFDFWTAKSEKPGDSA